MEGGGVSKLKSRRMTSEEFHTDVVAMQLSKHANPTLTCLLFSTVAFAEGGSFSEQNKVLAQLREADLLETS